MNQEMANLIQTRLAISQLGKDIFRSGVDRGIRNDNVLILQNKCVYMELKSILIRLTIA